MLESLIEGNTACKNICMNTLHYQDTPVFLMMCVTLTDKTDPSCPTKRENYWIDTLKIKAPMGLNFDFDYSF